MPPDSSPPTIFLQLLSGRSPVIFPDHSLDLLTTQPTQTFTYQLCGVFVENRNSKHLISSSVRSKYGSAISREECASVTHQLEIGLPRNVRPLSLFPGDFALLPRRIESSPFNGFTVSRFVEIATRNKRRDGERD